MQTIPNLRTVARHGPRSSRGSVRRRPAGPAVRLRAVESVEKCSWECFREGSKSRPVVVPSMGQPKRQRSRSIAQLSVATRARRAIWRAHVPTGKEFQYGPNRTKDPGTPARSRLALRVAPAHGSRLFPNHPGAPMKSATTPLSHGAPPVRTVEATASGDLPVTQPIDISGLCTVPAVPEAARES